MPVWEMPAGYYDAYFEHEPSYSINPVLSHYYPVWRIIASRIEPSRRVVDFGCGSGQLILLLRRMGINVVAGVDFSLKGLEIARKLNPDCLFVEKNLYNPFAYKFDFDLAIFSEVLEHIERDLVALHFLPDKTHVIFTLPDFYTPAHLRAFTSEDQIRERYGKVLDISFIEKVAIKDKMHIFIAGGIKHG